MAGAEAPAIRVYGASRQLIKLPCRIAEQQRLLVRGGAGGEPLERVPISRVAAGKLVDRKVALEHATLGTERGKAGLDIGPPRVGEFLRRGRALAVVKREAVDAHADAAELHIHVRRTCELGDAAPPLGEDFRALVGVPAEPERAAHVIEYDRLVRERPREVDQILELRVIEPGIEHEAHTAE